MSVLLAYRPPEGKSSVGIARGRASFAADPSRQVLMYVLPGCFKYDTTGWHAPIDQIAKSAGLETWSGHIGLRASCGVSGPPKGSLLPDQCPYPNVRL